MEVLRAKHIMDMCMNNKTVASEFLNLSRGSTTKYLKDDSIAVINGEVFIRKSFTNDDALDENRSNQHFDQFLDLAQSVLLQTRSVSETAELLSESKNKIKLNNERSAWRKRLSRWLDEGKLVL